MTLGTPIINSGILSSGGTVVTKISVSSTSGFHPALLQATAPLPIAIGTGSAAPTRVFITPLFGPSSPPPPTTPTPSIVTRIAPSFPGSAVISAPPPVSVPTTITPGSPTSSSVVAAPIVSTASVTSFPLGQFQENTGITLLEDEKPKIVAIIAENFAAGVPIKNILILKRLSPVVHSYIEIAYKLYKKNVLQGTNFELIKTISGSFSTISPELYMKISSSVSVNSNYLFVIEDMSLQPHTTYAYRLECDFSRDIRRFTT